MADRAIGKPGTVNDNSYYDDNAEALFASTRDVDMRPIYNRFLPLIQPGGHILDAGCGSGRDAHYFKDLGYAVTAIDASEPLCRLASELLNQNVACMRFEDIAWHGVFDGVWACASLLHVPRNELPGVFSKLFQAVMPGGVIYCSFKYGSHERHHDGRYFTDLTEEALGVILNEAGNDCQSESWLTEDQRPGRTDTWLNALLTVE